MLGDLLVGRRYGTAIAVDHLQVIESESARIVAALDANRGGRVPWSERWSVATVAKHVGGTHHVVAQVVDGRPDTDFYLLGPNHGRFVIACIAARFPKGGRYNDPPEPPR